MNMKTLSLSLQKKQLSVHQPNQKTNVEFHVSPLLLGKMK